MVRGAEPAALVEDRGAAAAVDGAVDASAAEQGGVRRVDDRVGAFAGDVALGEGEGGRHVCRSLFQTAFAALCPDMPCTPGPGGVADEQMKTAG